MYLFKSLIFLLSLGKKPLTDKTSYNEAVQKKGLVNTRLFFRLYEFSLPLSLLAYVCTVVLSY